MITYRPIDYDNHTDKEEILRMYREIFHVEFAADYAFWFESRHAGAPIGVLAVDDACGRVVGHFTTVRFRAVIAGSPQPFRMSMGFMTDPAYRGQGIATQLYRELKKYVTEAEDPTCFIIGFPNENSVHMHISRMEYEEYRTFHFVELPGRPEGVPARTFVPAEGFAGTGGGAADCNRMDHTEDFLRFRFSNSRYERYVSESGALFICTRFRDKVDIVYWSDLENEEELLAFAGFLHERDGVERVTTWNSLPYLDRYPGEERSYHMCINTLDCDAAHRERVLGPWVFLMGDCELF